MNCRQKVGLYDDFKENYEGHIKSVLFTGIKKGVYPEAKFDSDESELTLARLLDRDDDVLKWLRPAPNEFNIWICDLHKTLLGTLAVDFNFPFF